MMHQSSRFTVSHFLFFFSFFSLSPSLSHSNLTGHDQSFHQLAFIRQLHRIIVSNDHLQYHSGDISLTIYIRFRIHQITTIHGKKGFFSQSSSILPSRCTSSFSRPFSSCPLQSPNTSFQPTRPSHIRSPDCSSTTSVPIYLRKP